MKGIFGSLVFIISKKDIENSMIDFYENKIKFYW